MAKTALITGASGGIGLELAKIHAQQGDNVVLVARSQDKLNKIAEELTAQFGIKAYVIAVDLAEENAAERIFEQTQALGIQVDYLINNAGLGGHGKFAERDLADEMHMVQVNIIALMALTRLYLPAMLARQSGRILNVSSTASFMPGPNQAVYYRNQIFCDFIQPSSGAGSFRKRCYSYGALPWCSGNGLCSSRQFAGRGGLE